MKINWFLNMLVVMLLCNSCSTKKEILYFQDNENIPQEVVFNTTKIQVNDILDIKVSSLNPEAAIPYNRVTTNQNSGAGANMLKLQGYLVSNEGNITFPVLGTLNVLNKQTIELEEYIKNILVEGGHLKDPTVIVRIVNAKITILGEVSKPGTYDYDEETITLPQALGLAGDLTINGKRENIMIIREENQVRTVTHVDMTKTDWFTTPFYRIKQNDIIVVNPNGPKVKSAGYINNVGSLLGMVSFVITLVLLIKS
ncbi:polysaccharide biosynthesis/export family protein [Formosa haliotis]|uniref:polysaccharide biosynthesis/export family protein n=1 Tax=Formosa haliotis TaxID=1555194 RepID=UPI000826DAAC|nr:polysaccharide biosynthesis/export family protein [Formosa haliotis]